MSTNFVLSKSINLKNKKRLVRSQQEFKPFLTERVGTLVLDLDNVHTKKDYDSTLSYFNDKGYSAILGKSRSHNGVDNFNMKGLIKVNLPNTLKVLKGVLQQIQEDLGESIKVDTTVVGNVSLQAPTRNDSFIYHNENGVVLNESNIVQMSVPSSITVPTINFSEILFAQDIQDTALGIFQQLGFNMLSNRMNDNGSINFVHGKEMTSPGGYFWFTSSPMIMYHNVPEKRVNIFPLIKETQQGKDYIKKLNKTEQKQQINTHTDLSIYSDTCTLNQRYLTANDKVSDIIDKFIYEDESVLKIKSAMGTGKSNYIGECISKAHDVGQSVLIISNRISVAQDFSDKYNIKLYLDPEKVVKGESLVVQFDSLWKYNMQDFDIVILDEFMSIILHHRANLTSNQNFNVAKVYIALKHKKVIIADAFLTGYEDNFIKGKNSFLIENIYKDDVDLFEYKDKKHFVDELLNAVKTKKKNESISASFMSTNLLKAVEKELKEQGANVVVLTSETPEITKKLIYNYFEDTKNRVWDIILYTPVLTVGVSNVNNVTKHFHYDSGKAGDVISSLQMIKRSRMTQEIHFYLEERQFYRDTNIDTLNLNALTTIKHYYKGGDKSFLIDVDMKTGNFQLSDIGKYINQIEVFYNILENNHANAFRLLLGMQFQNLVNLKEKCGIIDINKKVKVLKQEHKDHIITLLEQHKEIDYHDEEIREIKAKTSELTEIEEIKVLLSNTKKNFNNLLDIKLIPEIAQHEVDQKGYIECMKKLSFIVRGYTPESVFRKVADQVSSDIASLQERNKIKFFEYIIYLGNEFQLQNWYSKNNIKEIDENIGVGDEFEKFLKSLGYKWNYNKLSVDETMNQYLQNIKEI